MPRSSFLNIKNNVPKRKKLIPSQGFFIDFAKNYQNNCFTEHLYMAASGLLKWQVL